MPNTKMRSGQGLTLVEVLVAVLMLAVFLVGLAPALTATAVLRRQGDEISLANDLAKQHLENLRAEWQGLSTAPGGQVGTSYTNNTVAANALLPTVAVANNFGAFPAVAGTTVATALQLDRAFNWNQATRQFVMVGTGLNTGIVPQTNTQFVVRTTIAATGPQSICATAVGGGACTDIDNAAGNLQIRFNQVRNAGANDVRLFKRVTVLVFRADAQGNPLGVGGAQVQPVRSTNTNDVATVRSTSGPLAVLTTDL